MAKRPGQPAKTHWLIVLGLCTLAFIPYARVLSNGFIPFFDDGSYVVNNANIQHGFTAEAIRWAFNVGYCGNWHPLTWLSHMADVQMFQMNPAGHHASNLALHVLNTVLLFFFLSKITKSEWKSAVVAALFAVHPLHVESVAWVAERKDVLSTFFLMLTLLAYARYTELPNIKRLSLVYVLFALGLMAKPMLVTLPLMLLLLDFWPLNRILTADKKQPRFNSHILIEKLPMFVMSAASCVVTYIAQQRGGALDAARTVSFGTRAANAVTGYSAYLLKTVWPTKLAILYPHPAATLPVWETVGSALLIAVITYGCVRSARTRPYLAFGWFWYLITLLPVIGFVQVGTQAMADRYTYIPLIGIFVLAVWGGSESVGGAYGSAGDKSSRRPAGSHVNATTIIVGVVLVTLAALTWVQTGYWKNDITLFEHTLAVTENNYTMEGNLGAVYAAKDDYNNAIIHLANAVHIRPDLADLRGSYGSALYAVGQIDEAVPQLTESLRIDPKQDLICKVLAEAKRKQKEAKGIDHKQFEKAIACFNEGNTLDGQGRAAQAESKYAEAIRLAPGYPDPYVNLARALYNRGETDQAIKLCKSAIKLRPDFGYAHASLAIYLFVKGRYAESWHEVHQADKYGSSPNADFRRMLAGKMPDPGK